MTGPWINPAIAEAACPSAKAYRAGCDCQGCRDAIARYERHRTWAKEQGRPISRPAIGVTRRLQALSAMGWSIRELADAAGVGRRNAEMCRTGDQKFVRLATYKRICDVYDRLWDQPGPSTRARVHAARCGWAPPLAWDEGTIDDPAARPVVGKVRPRTDPDVDLVAVDRWVTGDRHIKLTILEKVEALHRMLAGGMSLREATEALGVSHKRAAEYLAIGRPVAA